jgi:hypothetical protein
MLNVLMHILNLASLYRHIRVACFLGPRSEPPGMSPSQFDVGVILLPMDSSAQHSIFLLFLGFDFSHREKLLTPWQKSLSALVLTHIQGATDSCAVRT